MSGRNISLYLVAICCIGPFASGCKKSSSPHQPSENPQAGGAETLPGAGSTVAGPARTVARIHWLGKKRIAAETNSASFMSIWNLPESQKLEAQTLDKLALAPWGLPREGTNTAATVATNPPSLLLRPLLEDLLQEECYLEIRANTGPAQGSVARAASDTGRTAARTEFALAVRVDENRSHLWKTNLTSVFESLRASSIQHPGSGTQHPASSIQYPVSGTQPLFLRAGNWTIVTFSAPSANPASSIQHPAPQQSNNPPSALPDWLEQLAGQLGQNSNLFIETTNSAQTSSLNPQIQQSNNPTPDWLETELDLNGISSALGLEWHLPADIPKILLTMAAEGELVRTTGRLNFEKPLPLELDPWNIPTNLVHDPLSKFTAVRGLKSGLSSLEAWNDLQLGPPPNQLFFWGQGSLPITTFWAAPVPDASNHIYQFTEHLIHDINPWLATNSMGQFQRTTNANAAIWADLPFMEPYLRSLTLPEGDFILGSLGATPFTNRPAPSGLFEQFLPRTNLVAYDWELTGARIEPSLYNIQFLRFLFQRAQVPPESASIAWLRALESKLGNSATMVALTRPEVLSFVRRSTIGFTAVELQILADWLESPQFPNGLTTFVGQPEPRPTHRHQTNSVPQPAPGK